MGSYNILKEKEAGSVWNVDIPQNTENFLDEENNQRGSDETFA